MNRRGFFLMAVLVVAGFLSGQSSAHAQGGLFLPNQYRPSRPTLSPYLDLFRRDTGPLPNYFTFVRPRQQVQTQIQQQAYNMQLLQQQTNTLEDQALAPATGANGAQPRFQNYLHYYPTPQSRRR